MNDSLEEARREFHKADKLFKIGFVVFLAYLAIISTATAVITYNIAANLAIEQEQVAEQRAKDAEVGRANIRKLIEDNTRQHVVTQQYIRCIAQVLLKPLAQRTDNEIVACGIPGVVQASVPDNGDDSVVSIQPSSQPITRAPTTQPSPAAPPPPGASPPPSPQPPAPPAPQPPAAQPQRGLLQGVGDLVDGLLNVIGL